MAEEVPTPRQRQYPLWKEYSLLEKAWILFQDFIPLLIWMSIGFIFVYFGSD